LKLIRCVDWDLRARIQKYEMRVGNDRFTNDSFSAHLKAKMSDANVELSMDQIFGNVRFDNRIKDPVERSAKRFSMWKH
jgi:hypothetical protein